MLARTDKRRIYQLIDMYLSGKINESTFCNEFYSSYDLELNYDTLLKDECEEFYNISVISSRFCGSEEDVKKYPGVYSTKNELNEIIKKTKLKLRKHFIEFENSLKQIKITESQLDILRSVLGELCFGLKFEDYICEINTNIGIIVKIYNETYIEDAIKLDKIGFVESEKRLLAKEGANLILQFYCDEIKIIVKSLTIVMREITECEFLIRIGHEYKEAQNLLAILQHTSIIGS